LLFTWIFMMCLPLFSIATGSRPFTPGADASSGLFGLGTLSLLFFASHAIHGPRIWRRVVNMAREQHSEYEGDTLPFFVELPFGDRFWMVRLVYEPLLVLVAAIVLHLIPVFDLPAMIYLIIAAALLAVKNFLSWYQSRLHLRTLMDAKFAGPLVAKAASGKATEEELAQVHLAGFPKNVPADIRMAAIIEMTPGRPRCLRTLPASFRRSNPARRRPRKAVKQSL
jgi:hypothetical protein